MQMRYNELDYYVSGLIEHFGSEAPFSFDDRAAKRWGPAPHIERLVSSSSFGQRAFLVDDELRRLVLEKFSRLEGCSVDDDPFGPTMYVIEGAHTLSMIASLRPGSPYEKANRYGRDWIENAIAKIEVEPELNEDRWASTRFDDDETLLQEALEASTEAIEEVRSSNEYGNADASEQRAIVATMQGSVEALKQGRMNKDTVLVGLYKPLQYLAKKFGDASIGQLAKIAVSALAKVLGLSS